MNKRNVNIYPPKLLSKVTKYIHMYDIKPLLPTPISTANVFLS